MNTTRFLATTTTTTSKTTLLQQKRFLTSQLPEGEDYAVSQFPSEDSDFKDSAAFDTSSGNNALGLPTTEYQLCSSMLREVLRVLATTNAELAMIKADIAALKMQGTRPAMEVPPNLEQPSVFGSILHPARTFPHPRDASGRRRWQFSWSIYRDLVDHVLGDQAGQFSHEDFLLACDNIRTSDMLAGIKSDICSRYSIPMSQSWGKVPANVRYEAQLKLEEAAAPFLPLRACLGNWGAKMMLSKHWNNQGAKREVPVGLEAGDQEPEGSCLPELVDEAIACPPTESVQPSLTPVGSSSGQEKRKAGKRARPVPSKQQTHVQRVQRRRLQLQ